MSTGSQNIKGADKSATLLAKFDKELHDKSNFFEPWLAKLEERTKVKRNYIAIGFVFLLAVYLIIGYAAELICNGIGFLYPAYQSLKALESSSKEDDTKWLMYWVVFATFSLVEFFSDCILSWFPPYYLAKLVFLIWLSLPISRNGTDFMYHKIIRPFFLRNQSHITEAENYIATQVNAASRKFD